MDNRNDSQCSIEKSANELLADIEALGAEIRLKLALAGMDVRDAWDKKLEPRLFEARVHAREAKSEAKEALKSTLNAFEAFASEL
jgi:hypothetical protein